MISAPPIKRIGAKLSSSFRLYGELHRFIPALASWYGASICEIPIKNIVRPKGNSHYGISPNLPRIF